MTLKQYIEKEDWDGMAACFRQMSNSQFRLAEGNARNVLMSLPNDRFWKAYLHLLMYRHQSFLAGILAIGHLARKDELDFCDDNALQLARWLNENHPEAIQKVVRMAVPLLTTESQYDGLLNLFGCASEIFCVSAFLHLDSALAYYMLFKSLKRVEDIVLVRKCIVILVQKHNDLSYNMASILSTYFGVDMPTMTFSLHVEPYELSYLEQSFTNFNHMLNGRRPNL